MKDTLGSGGNAIDKMVKAETLLFKFNRLGESTQVVKFDLRRLEPLIPVLKDACK